MSITDERDPDPGHSTGSGGGTPGGDEPGNGGTTNGGGEDDAGATAVTHPDRYSWAPYLVGFTVLLGYAIFLSVMMRQVREDTQLFWDRYLYLFSSVEALAFAAAGFFFGREVNRGRAEAAESRANTEAKRATRAESNAADAKAKGDALSEEVRNMFEGSSPAAETRVRGVAPTDATGEAPMVAIPAHQLRGVVRLADRWFPRR